MKFIIRAIYLIGVVLGSVMNAWCDEAQLISPVATRPNITISAGANNVQLDTYKTLTDLGSLKDTIGFACIESDTWKANAVGYQLSGFGSACRGFGRAAQELNHPPARVLEIDVALALGLRISIPLYYLNTTNAQTSVFGELAGSFSRVKGGIDPRSLGNESAWVAGAVLGVGTEIKIGNKSFFVSYRYYRNDHFEVNGVSGPIQIQSDFHIGLVGTRLQF